MLVLRSVLNSCRYPKTLPLMYDCCNQPTVTFPGRMRNTCAESYQTDFAQVVPLSYASPSDPLTN
jgi:hypothetical protein